MFYYSKVTKRFIASKVKVDKSYSFMRNIAEASYFRAVDSNKRTSIERDSRKRELFVAPEEKPDRDETIANSLKYSRLK